MEGRLIANPLFHSRDLERIYSQYQTKVDVSTKIKALKKKIQAANAIMQLDELKNRKRVLRRLGFTSSSDVIEMKGRFPLSVSSNFPELLVRLVLPMNSF
jgi:ATP-dependent RNA helicase DOB1